MTSIKPYGVAATLRYFGMHKHIIISNIKYLYSPAEPRFLKSRQFPKFVSRCSIVVQGIVPFNSSPPRSQKRLRLSRKETHTAQPTPTALLQPSVNRLAQHSVAKSIGSIRPNWRGLQEVCEVLMMMQEHITCSECHEVGGECRVMAYSVTMVSSSSTSLTAYLPLTIVPTNLRIYFTYQYDDRLHRQEALGDRDQPRVHECLRTDPSVHSLV